MSNKYQIIEEEYYYEDMKITRSLKVSNTYPLFLKIQEDMKRNKYLYGSLKGKEWNRGFEKYVVYAERINNSLIEFIKELYVFNKHQGYPFYETIFEWSDYQIIQMLYQGYKLIFLKGHNDLIMLNYVPQSERVELALNELLIPSGIPHEHDHVQNVYYFNKQYRAVNTFNAFLSFAKYNKYEPRRDMNNPFFGSFRTSVINVEINTIDSCREVLAIDSLGRNTEDYKFKYFILEDIIVITDYISIPEQYNMIATFTPIEESEEDDGFEEFF